MTMLLKTLNKTKNTAQNNEKLSAVPQLAQYCSLAKNKLFNFNPVATDFLHS